MELRSSQDDRIESALKVVEIYKSIQGESTWAGIPCIFVRLSGCGIGCAYCDTAYAYEGGAEQTIREILERCAELSCELVEITGGEPLLQEECPTLAACLLERNYMVLIETSGTVSVAQLPPGAIKIMDIKCPSSGVCDKNYWANLDALTSRDEVKFVIGDRNDYDWSCEIVRKQNLPSRCRQVLFSPVFGVLAPHVLAEWIVKDGLNVRFQLQLQKFIWPSAQRGV